MWTSSICFYMMKAQWQGGFHPRNSTLAGSQGTSMHTLNSQVVPLASLGLRRCGSFFICVRTFQCLHPAMLTHGLGPYSRVWTLFIVQMTNFFLSLLYNFFVWLADRPKSDQSVQVVADRATQEYCSLISVGSFLPTSCYGEVAHKTDAQLLVLRIVNFWNSNHRKPVIKSYGHYQ